MVECEICLEEYREGDLELHRASCVVRLMYRCSLCNEDYVSQEGLWNHLAMHEISDESNELHYQEVKATHKLHQCALCNDQRAYSESPYWKHVQDVHDGFYLRCSDCGENFRSEKLRNEHTITHIKASDEPSNNAAEEHDNQLNEDSPVLNKDLSKPFPCDNCGVPFSSKGFVLRHKRGKFSCLRKKQRNCAHCWRVLQPNKYEAHRLLCSKRKFSCTLCPFKFDAKSSILRHMKIRHPIEVVEESTASSQENLVSSSNVAEDGTKCARCGKECVTAANLRHHIVKAHHPTTCSICGHISEGSSKARYHTTMEHSQPKYDCGNCSQKFHSMQGYERHANLCGIVDCDTTILKSSRELILSGKCDPTEATDNSDVKCSHCGTHESSAVTLTRHILIYHEPVACDLCGITFPSLFDAHLHKKTTHNKSKLKCPNCSKSFTWKWRLDIHIVKCENKESGCDYCGKLFKDVYTAKTHRIKNCRVYKRHKAQGLEDDKIWTSVVSGMSQTRCYYCIEDFPSPENLTDHLRMNHQLTKCDVCEIAILGISPVKNHKIKCHLEPKHECLHCGEKFHCKQVQLAHCLVCEQKKYSCKLCERTFTHRISLKRHSERYHPNGPSVDSLNDDGFKGSKMIKTEPPMVAETATQSGKNPPNKQHSCKICGITLSSTKRMGYHTLTKHKEPKFQCPHCSRKFHIKIMFRNHLLCCANLKFSCELCGQRFNFQKKMVDHKERDHRGGETVCIFCRNTFVSSDELMAHKLTCSKQAADQGENVGLKLDIKVEETELQEYECEFTDEDRHRAATTILLSHNGESLPVEAEDATELVNGIQLKKECPEDQEGQLSDPPSAATDSTKSHDTPSHRKLKRSSANISRR